MKELTNNCMKQVKDDDTDNNLTTCYRSRRIKVLWTLATFNKQHDLIFKKLMHSETKTAKMICFSLNRNFKNKFNFQTNKLKQNL